MICSFSDDVILGVDSLCHSPRYTLTVYPLSNDTSLPEAQTPESDGRAEPERCLRNSTSLWGKSGLSKWYEGNHQ